MFKKRKPELISADIAIVQKQVGAEFVKRLQLTRCTLHDEANSDFLYCSA